MRSFLKLNHIYMGTVHPKIVIDQQADVLAVIAHAILLIQKQTGYGSIEITVHNGRVTQIERREKVRFDAKSTSLKK